MKNETYTTTATYFSELEDGRKQGIKIGKKEIKGQRTVLFVAGSMCGFLIGGFLAFAMKEDFAIYLLLGWAILGSINTIIKRIDSYNK